MRSVKSIAPEFELNEPAGIGSVADLEAKLGRLLPSDYKEFLNIANGGEGPIGSSGYLRLWPTEQVPEMNNGYQIEEYFPGLVAIGTDGGGTAYAIDFRKSGTSIVEFQFIDNLSEVQSVSGTFGEFLEAMSKL